MTTLSAPNLYALTGVIGSGKSQVSQLLEKEGISVLKADEISRYVVRKGSDGLKKVIKAFGKEILNSDQELDRQKLASIIFQDPTKKIQLEAVLHPIIRAEFESRLEKFTNKDIVVYDIPLFFEVKYSHPLLKGIIVVKASPINCIKRIIQRDHISQEQAQLRLNSQIPIEEKVKRADYVIDNDGLIDELEVQIPKLIAWMMGEIT